MDTVPSYSEVTEMKPNVEPAIEAITEYRMGKYYKELNPLLSCESSIGYNIIIIYI